MTSKSYPTRTTLWDNPPAGDPAGAETPTATVSRGAWRAPSAVLSGERPARPTAGSRSVSSGSVASGPVASGFSTNGIDEEDDHAPIPRRTKFGVVRSPWWRPRSTFGRILLGFGVTLTVAAVASGAFITRRFLVRDPHFRIPGASSIQSSGLSEVNRADVLPVFGEDIGRNIFFVPLAERRHQLEQIPWVQQATVMRFLPDRLSVSIVERTPVAFVRQGDQVELADADGVILSMPPSMMAQHHYSFPVIIGIDAKDSLAGRRARMAVYQRFLAELDQNHQHLTEQISEIDLSDPEDLRATMPAQGSDVLAHFGQDHFLDRLAIYKAHIAEWRQRYPQLKGVDLRYNGEVPLEMETGRETAESDAPTVRIPSVPTPKPAAATVRLQAPVKLQTAATVKAKSTAAKPAHAPATAKPVSAEDKERAAKLKKARAAKAAREKAALHKPNTIAHPTSATPRQGI